ncbi:hypothetical protein GCM10009716_38580 [Streptomyces sodiiphilus]|uniref:HTH cro/C1-type domain-containing protein n=1 Tax=Streptomyces sodiiphilus TaxID=226217 RepID=A0ABN2PN95_9ACTN
MTERYFSMLENGKRTPSAKLLGRIASELGVPVASLLSEDAPEAPKPQLTTAPDVARALMSYGSSGSAPAAGPSELRERVEAAWRVWQSSAERFSEIEPALPDLIVDVEKSVRAHRLATDATARRDVLRTAADLYGLLRSYCRRSGRLDLALMVADRARRAAEDADDPIRIAAANWNLGHCLLSQEDGAQEAEDIAQLAVRELESVPEARRTRRCAEPSNSSA